jgi:hypothetical protein
LSEAWEAVVASKPRLQPLRERHRIEMRHCFFDGKLPAWLGADRVISLPGSSATLVQGQVTWPSEPGANAETIGQSWRAYADLSTDEIHTSLPSGPRSDSACTQHYSHHTADTQLAITHVLLSVVLTQEQRELLIALLRE